jgi:hypothetical protein
MCALIAADDLEAPDSTSVMGDILHSAVVAA